MIRTPESILKKLKEYEGLEEQGRLVRLPCKVGDTVFVLLNKPYGIQETKVNRIVVIGSKPKVTTEMIRISGGMMEWSFEPSDIGKTIFLAREEAEKALRMEEPK